MVDDADRRIKELEDMIEAQTGQRPAQSPLAQALVEPTSTANPELQRAKNELLAAEADLRSARIECDREYARGNLTERQEAAADYPVHQARNRVDRAKARVAELEGKH